jgi:protein-S-isoprenylcysteine O-methyltransferase Ste14
MRMLKMKRNKAIELATYIIVPTVMWVLSPMLGKYIDAFYFHYPNILATSLAIVLPGILLALCGTALAVWTIFLFKTEGQGTPNPKLPPKVFVVSGPYRFSRNPMAFGGLLILLGETAFYYSPSLLGISILYGIIIYLNAMFIEEPELIKRFGEPYTDYLRRVPRFFPTPGKWYKE